MIKVAVVVAAVRYHLDFILYIIRTALKMMKTSDEMIAELHKAVGRSLRYKRDRTIAENTKAIG